MSYKMTGVAGVTESPAEPGRQQDRSVFARSNDVVGEWLNCAIFAEPLALYSNLFVPQLESHDRSWQVIADQIGALAGIVTTTGSR
ncbi:MAG: hypothetical protein RIR86_1859 [Acidobacteriota bacterium]|jgi:hypothetical protein